MSLLWTEIPAPSLPAPRAARVKEEGGNGCLGGKHTSEKRTFGEGNNERVQRTDVLSNETLMPELIGTVHETKCQERQE